MTHYRILMIGKIENLDQIYADCQDSSSETAAEMTFGYDYCNPYNIKENKHAYFIGEEAACVFGKESEIFKEYVLEGCFYDIWDIRGNDCDHLIFNGDNPRQSFDEVIEFLKSLSDDTTFFYCDAHL